MHSLLLVANAKATPYMQGNGSEGLVSIEAENFDQHIAQGDHQWLRVSPAGASGDAMEGSESESSGGYYAIP